MRDKIKDTVNKILLTENAKAISEDDLLIASELDSFGYMILWVYLDSEFQCFDKEYLNNIDYKTYTLQDLINRVIEYGQL